MQIEEYLVEDQELETILDGDKLEEWKEKCEEMGLEGQLKLCQEGASPIPFRIMSKEEQRVYNTLLTSHCAVKEFASEMIPLRVLSLIALAEKEQYFYGVSVWYSEMDKDPIVIGKQEEVYNSPLFLIARWGEELESFVILKQRAIEKAVATKKSQLTECIDKATGLLQNLETHVAAEMEGKYISWPS